jgi:hypothetical protein
MAKIFESEKARQEYYRGLQTGGIEVAAVFGWVLIIVVLISYLLGHME